MSENPEQVLRLKRLDSKLRQLYHIHVAHLLKDFHTEASFMAWTEMIIRDHLTARHLKQTASRVAISIIFACARLKGNSVLTAKYLVNHYRDHHKSANINRDVHHSLNLHAVQFLTDHIVRGENKKTFGDKPRTTRYVQAIRDMAALMTCTPEIVTWCLTQDVNQVSLIAREINALAAAFLHISMDRHGQHTSVNDMARTLHLSASTITRSIRQIKTVISQTHTNPPQPL